MSRGGGVTCRACQFLHDLLVKSRIPVHLTITALVTEPSFPTQTSTRAAFSPMRIGLAIVQPQNRPGEGATLCAMASWIGIVAWTAIRHDKSREAVWGAHRNTSKSLAAYSLGSSRAEASSRERHGDGQNKS